eukprot:CAMPEP_0179190392 /NCGR_PEP_ID=MMETSP0796-20121207/94534_1 /TAXON_ID=73915 /ORGANISM="Pyrodinium bahamense, Strain pbaha01" /LENGTH=236 /DNA_ID=CAMNT_0020894557 /DNA_START=631 /DNA_END=1342 /DNA_ORIENTATION=+
MGSHRPLRPQRWPLRAGDSGEQVVRPHTLLLLGPRLACKPQAVGVGCSFHGAPSTRLEACCFAWDMLAFFHAVLGTGQQLSAVWLAWDSACMALLRANLSSVSMQQLGSMSLHCSRLGLDGFRKGLKTSSVLPSTHDMKKYSAGFALFEQRTEELRCFDLQRAPRMNGFGPFAALIWCCFQGAECPSGGTAAKMQQSPWICLEGCSIVSLPDVDWLLAVRISNWALEPHAAGWHAP